MDGWVTEMMRKKMTHNAPVFRPNWQRLVIGLFVAIVCMGEDQAANPRGSLRVEVIADPNFVVDSNVGTPASQSPRAAYLGAKIWNDGATDLTNVVAPIGT